MDELAGELSGALERAEQESRRNRLFGELGGSIDLEELMDRVLDAAMEIPGFDAAMMVVERQDGAPAVVTRGMTRRRVRAAADIGRRRDAARHDHRQLPLRTRSGGPDPELIRGGAFVPLMGRELRPVGTLSLFWRTPDHEPTLGRDRAGRAPRRELDLGDRERAPLRRGEEARRDGRAHRASSTSATSRRRSAARWRLTTREADAEALPFPDASFDAVLSVFGVMFVPRPERAASELVRVCRSRGRIGLVSWTPGSFIGDMFRTIARHVPPPPVPSVFAWGDEEVVERLLGPAVELTSVRRREFVFRYMSARDFVDTFRTYYGPTHRAFAAVLDASGRQAQKDELLALAESANRSAAGVLAVPSEYLEVVASRS